MRDILLIFLYFIPLASNKKLVLPFTKSSMQGVFEYELVSNTINYIVFVGNPKSKVRSDITFDENEPIYISKGPGCLYTDSTYDPDKSYTHRMEGISHRDDFYFYSDFELTKQVNLKDTKFYMTSELFAKCVCMKTSFILNPLMILPYLAKNQSLADKEYFYFKYTNDNTGFLVVGEYQHQNDDNFKDYQTVNDTVPANPMGGNLNWGINFDDVYDANMNIRQMNYSEPPHRDEEQPFPPDDEVDFDSDEYEKERKENKNYTDECLHYATFYPEMNGIGAPFQYFEYLKQKIFKEMFNKSLCNESYIQAESGSYYLIKCRRLSQNFINNFPKLTFENKKLNTKFEFSGNELFVHDDKNALTYMKIFKVSGKQNIWVFGKTFFMKYPGLGFDSGNKLLIYYDSSKKKTKNSNTNWVQIGIIIGVSVVAVGLIVAVVFLAKKLYQKKKKRANELDDEFEYKRKIDIENGGLMAPE